MKVLIIDDHNLFRSGLQSLLEQRDIEVVAAVGSGKEGLKHAQSLDIDVVLLDLRMPGEGGLEILRRLKEQVSDIPVVMLTTSTDEQDLLESLRIGAQGYLLKDMEPDELVVALFNAKKGETIVAPGLTSVLARAVQQGDTEELDTPESAFDVLTPREREILSHLSEGQSNKVIARHLGISDGTVKLHVKSILRKLHVHSRVQAAVMAVEKGLNK